ncbi:MAG: FKBP-type peptidyl-prolyl cis-trans isomerase [Desulfobacterales bacterium]|nr:FKBP-type peptidyl-prolyl cis-trans isomerase [Desulfobacterales bacterium]MCP4159262.1 FKBP-type peptidyl-prolyl cis-trans isomerase [Deltaproteobacteria bacterium]
MKIDNKKVSYILGRSIGEDFRRQGFEIDAAEFTEAMVEALNQVESKMSMAEMQQIMTSLRQHHAEKQKAEMDKQAVTNVEDGKKFLEENKTKDGVFETESGLQYRIIEEGKGDSPSATSTVTTNYEGKTLDGQIFDSSYERGTPASFPVNGVIQGWQEALPLMKKEAIWELFIPSDLAYGAAGSPPKIGPHSVLIFKIELISF